MAGVRANWHLGDLEVPDDIDPMQEITRLKSEARRIDLSPPRSEQEIADELAALVVKEGRYAKYAKVSCELKWRAEHVLMGGTGLSCFACPHFTESMDEARSVVCRVARRQEQVNDELIALRAPDSLDAELAQAFEREVAAYEELAEALA